MCKNNILKIKFFIDMALTSAGIRVRLCDHVTYNQGRQLV